MFSIDITAVLPFVVSKRSSFSFVKLGWVRREEFTTGILKNEFLMEDSFQGLSVDVVLLIHVDATESVFLGTTVTFCEENVHGMCDTVMGNDVCLFLDGNTIVLSCVITLAVVASS